MEKFCDYGCGNVGNFTLKNGKKCCCKSYNQCPILRAKNSVGGKLKYKEGRISFFVSADEARKKSNESRIKNLKQKPFEQWGKKLKKQLILEEQNYLCLHCNSKMFWNDKELTFELDHVDGNSTNNKRENLRMLCPNCHSQTITWRGRNSNKGKQKVSDEKIISTLKETKNLRQTLLINNLAAKGGNYKRLYSLIKKFELENIFNKVL